MHGRLGICSSQIRAVSGRLNGSFMVCDNALKDTRKEAEPCPENFSKHGCYANYATVVLHYPLETVEPFNPQADLGRSANLVHLFDQSIDILFPVPQITPFNKVLELPRPETASGIAKLERP